MHTREILKMFMFAKHAMLLIDAVLVNLINAENVMVLGLDQRKREEKHQLNAFLKTFFKKLF